MKVCFFTIALAALLTACGGSAGYGVMPAGYWTNADAAVLITKSGEVWAISSEYGALAFTTGIVTSTGTSTATATVTEHTAAALVNRKNISITFKPKQLLTLFVNANEVINSETLSYNAIYEKTPTLSYLRGTWRDIMGNSFFISPSGTVVVLFASGCTAGGMVTPSITGENFYRLSLRTEANTDCSIENLLMDGIVTENTSASIMIGLKAGSAGASYALTKQ